MKRHDSIKAVCTRAANTFLDTVQIAGSIDPGSNLARVICSLPIEHRNFEVAFSPNDADRTKQVDMLHWHCAADQPGSRQSRLPICDSSCDQCAQPALTVADGCPTGRKAGVPSSCDSLRSAPKV